MLKSLSCIGLASVTFVVMRDQIADIRVKLKGANIAATARAVKMTSRQLINLRDGVTRAPHYHNLLALSQHFGVPLAQ